MGLDEETRTAIAAAIERLRPLGKAVAWVPAENLHLTLKFLGEQTDERLAEAALAIEEAAAATSAIHPSRCTASAAFQEWSGRASSGSAWPRVRFRFARCSLRWKRRSSVEASTGRAAPGIRT